MNQLLFFHIQLVSREVANDHTICELRVWRLLFLRDASAGSNCFVRTRAAMKKGGLESMGLKTIAGQVTFYGSTNIVFHEFI